MTRGVGLKSIPKSKDGMGESSRNEHGAGGGMLGPRYGYGVGGGMSRLGDG